jgi:hypothetical protein
MGPIGLVEAPRSGRPVKPTKRDLSRLILLPGLLRGELEYGESPGAAEIARRAGSTTAVVWRVARLAGVNLDRQRMRHAPTQLPSETALHSVVAMAIGPSVSLVAIAPEGRSRQAITPSGRWLYPKGAVPEALSREGGRAPDVSKVLDALALTPNTPDAPRAVRERKRSICDYLAKLAAARIALDVVVGGRPQSEEFVDWLVALRARRLTPGHDHCPITITYSMEREGWCAAIGDRLRRGFAQGEAVQQAVSAFAFRTWTGSGHFWWMRPLMSWQPKLLAYFVAFDVAPR